ncbi:hypothetical protein [Aeoliella sp.]|uniref:hypothetical protein n=1 Tax=Aeoliella sp. TaxID=2795800 RepID=UPI003CCBEBE5
MPQLTPPLLLTLLEITSLAMGGLLGLWAATSRWHWFARCTVVLGLLAPLLCRPIYEPFVTLLVEVATVVLGVAIYRRRWPRWQFSLSGVMMFTVVVAVVMAGLARAPEMDFYLWRAVFGMGVVSGSCTLLATWLVTTNRWLGASRAIAVCLAVPAMGLAWSMFEYTSDVFDVCERQCNAPLWYWTGFELWWFELVGEGTRAVALLISLLALPVLLWRIAHPLRLGVRKGILGVCIAILGAWPAFVAIELLTPIPVPQPARGDNAYDDLVALGNRLVETEAPKLTDGDVSLVQQCLARPIAVIKQYDRNLWEVDDNNREALVTVAQAISLRAEYARENGQSELAFESTLLLFEFARKLEGQGRRNELGMSVRIEFAAVNSAYHTLPLLDRSQTRQLLKFLIKYVEDRPSLAPVLLNEHCYEQHATGWGGHLGQYLSQLSMRQDNHSIDYLVGIVRPPEQNEGYLKARTFTSLLTTELLLNEHVLAQDSLPETLEQLADLGSPSIWGDPFSESNATFVYKPNGSQFKLYSRWEDHQDNGGVLVQTKNSAFGNIYTDYEGDLSLEDYFGHFK